MQLHSLVRPCTRFPFGRVGFGCRAATAYTAGTVWYRTQPKSIVKRNPLYPTQTRILGVAPEMRVFRIVVPAIRSLAFTLPCWPIFVWRPQYAVHEWSGFPILRAL
jgi:hypothetical protein